MTTSHTAGTAREAARQRDGKFGTQHLAEADDIDLVQDPAEESGGGYVPDEEILRLQAEWDTAFADLKAAGLEHDADHPVAARYREASNTVNHANRKRDFAIATNTPYVPREHKADPAASAAAMVEDFASQGRYVHQATDEEFAVLASSADPYVRAHVASHARDAALLDTLAADEDGDVRMGASENPHTSAGAYTALCEDSSPQVARVAQTVRLFRNSPAAEAFDENGRARRVLSLDQRNVILKQIGSGNMMAISGGRGTRLRDGIELPVSGGYRVRVRLGRNDTYSVQRVFTRGGKDFDKGTRREIYADEVGEVAYRASCFHDEPGEHGFG